MTPTKKTVHTVKLSSETNLAIMWYRKVMKATKHLEKVEEQYQRFVDMIPKDDMIHFVKITEEMENE